MQAMLGEEPRPLSADFEDVDLWAGDEQMQASSPTEGIPAFNGHFTLPSTMQVHMGCVSKLTLSPRRSQASLLHPWQLSPTTLLMLWVIA